MPDTVITGAGDRSAPAARSGAISGGTYPSGNYFVGGYNLEGVTILDTLTTGVFNGAFVLRGYPPGAYAGRQYVLQSFEYRLPILKPDRGLFTLPIYLQRIDGNVFLDYGGAFNDFNPDAVKFFNDGNIIDSPQLHTSIGAELWFGVTLGYLVYSQFRLGYAYGFSREAIPNGQLYFVASSAF